MDRIVDFTKYDRSFKYYSGADNKWSIVIDGNNYMLKLPNILTQKNELQSSYSNNVFSEYLGCKIFQSIGFETQEVFLGTYQGKYAVACKDFTSSEFDLVEFSKIENQIIDSRDRGRIPTLENLNVVFHSKDAFFNDFGVKAKERYWNTFIVDALIGNFDRHCGNWGYLINTVNGAMKNAPIYDCGSSLYPQMSDHAIPEILNSEAKIQERIDVFPKAALLVDGKKVGYKDFICSMENVDCNQALLRVMPQINMTKIQQLIKNMPLISDTRRMFYAKMIESRYEGILLEPYRTLEKKQQKQNQQSISHEKPRLNHSRSMEMEF